MRVTEFPLQRLDNDSSNPFDALSEAFVFGSDKSVTVEIVVDDAVLRFGNESYDVSNGDQLFVSESAATFLSLKGWEIGIIHSRTICIFSCSDCGKVQG